MNSVGEEIPKISRNFAIVRIIYACIQNFLMGGVVYGWAAISGSMMIGDTDDGCVGMSSLFAQMVFMIAISFSCMSPLFTSGVLEWAGPRATSIVCTFVFSVGCGLFGLSTTHHRKSLFIPGLCLVAFAGPGVHAATCYTSSYFPKSKTIIIALQSCAFHLSFLVLPIMNTILQAQQPMDKETSNVALTYRGIFVGYSFMCIFTVFFSVLIMPDTSEAIVIQPPEYERLKDLDTSKGKNGTPTLSFIELNERSEDKNSDSSNKELGRMENGRRGEDVAVYKYESIPYEEQKNISCMDTMSDAPTIMNMPLRDTRGPMDEDSSSSTSSAYQLIDSYDVYKNISLWEKLKCAVYLRFALFFALANFWVNFHISTVDMSLGDSTLLSPGQNHKYAILLTYILAGGCLSIPLWSYVMSYNNGLMGMPLSLCLLSVISMLWSLFLLFDTSVTILPSFVLCSLFRTFLFTFSFVYIDNVFGSAYYDVLVGNLFLCSGILNLLAIPFQK